jgi:ribosomal protein L27
LTTTGSSGAATYSGGTLNIPTYTLAGLGGQPALNGTGFVKISGTTISYDNSTYLTTSSAASTYLPLAGGTLTGALNGTSASFSGNMNADDYNMAQWKILDWNGVVAQIGGISASQWNQLEFFTSGTSKLILNTSGNLGLGVTPSAWGGTAKAIQIGARMTVYTDGVNNALFGNNTFFDGGNNIYISSDAASRFYLENTGAFLWQQAPSGTAGNAISFTTAMTLSENGNLLVGGTNNPYSLGRAVFVHNSSFTRTYFQRGVDLIEIVPSDGTQPNQISSSYTASGSAYKPLSLSARQNIADLYLSTSGQVGINTTTPQRTLDVIGSANDTPAASFGRGLPIGGWSGIHFGYSEAGNSSYRKSAIVFERTGSAADGKIHILNNAATDISSASLSDARLTILPAGSVGIGTTTPNGAYMLTLNGDSSTKLGGIVCRQSGTDTFYMGNPTVTNTTDFEFWNPRNGYVRFGTNNIERVRITSGGNMEILTGWIKTGEPGTGWGTSAIKIGARQNGTAFNGGSYLPVSIDGTIYYINLFSSTP